MSLAPTPDGGGAAPASREARAAQYRELAAAALAKAERADLEAVGAIHRASAARWLVLARTEERFCARGGAKTRGETARLARNFGGSDASA